MGRGLGRSGEGQNIKCAQKVMLTGGCKKIVKISFAA